MPPKEVTLRFWRHCALFLSKTDALSSPWPHTRHVGASELGQNLARQVRNLIEWNHYWCLENKVVVTISTFQAGVNRSEMETDYYSFLLTLCWSLWWGLVVYYPNGVISILKKRKLRKANRTWTTSTYYDAWKPENQDFNPYGSQEHLSRRNSIGKGPGVVLRTVCPGRFYSGGTDTPM